jgi:hypothetical protein
MKQLSRRFWFVLLVLAARGSLAEPDPALVDLYKGAGVEMKYGVGNPGGRDFDSANLSTKDILKIQKEAARRGYKIEPPRGNSITIKGTPTNPAYKPLKESTFHHEPVTSDPVGSSAADAYNQGGNDKENFRGRPDPKTGKVVTDAKGQVKATVTDLLGKGSSQHHPLKTNPKSMSTDQLKDLGKMVAKVMDAGGINNPQLQQQAEILHNTGDPAKAGIKDINEFQQQGRDVATEAVRNENKVIQQERLQLNQEVRQAKQQYNEAKKSGTPQEVATAKAKLEAAKGRAIQYNSHINGTTAKATANGAAEIYAKANGYEPVKNPDGTTSFRDPRTGKLVSKSAMTEAVCKANNVNLRPPKPAPGIRGSSVVDKPPPGAKPMGPVMKTAGIGLLIYSLYHGGIEAYNKMQAEKQAGDGFLKSAGKFLGYTFLNATGIQHAMDTGTEAGNIAVDQYNQDVKDNKITGTGIRGSLWYGFYKFGGAVNGSLEFLTQMFVDPLIAGGTAIKEGVGAVTDSLDAAKNEAQAKATEKEAQTKAAEKAAEKAQEKAANKDKTVDNTGEAPEDKPPQKDEINPPDPDADKPADKPEKPVLVDPDKPAPEQKDAQDGKTPDEEKEDDDKFVAPDPDATPPPVTPEPPANDPTTPPGFTKEFKGYVSDPKGKIEVHEIKDPEGNVVNVIHTTYGPDGQVIETKEYPANGSATPANGPFDIAGAWKGTLTFTRVIMPDQITIEDPMDPKAKPTIMTRQQCEEKLEIGKPRPLSPEFRPTSPTTGFMVITDDKKGTKQESPYTLQDNRIVIRQTQQGATTLIEGVFTREGDQWVLNAPVAINLAPEGKQLAKVEGELRLTKPAN